MLLSKATSQESLIKIVSCAVITPELPANEMTFNVQVKSFCSVFLVPSGALYCTTKCPDVRPYVIVIIKVN